MLFFDATGRAAPGGQGAAASRRRTDVRPDEQFQVTFVNRGHRPVALYWQSHDGEVVLQHHGLHAGEETEAQVGTFLGHRPVAVPRNT